MKKRNKFNGKIEQSDEESKNSNENESITSFRNTTNEENIIKDLRLKGFNENQIGDILETFTRNSVGIRPSFNENGNSNIQQTNTIEDDMPSSARIIRNQGISNKYRKIEYINNNSKYKNSFILKTEKVEENNKNESKDNIAKLYINESSMKNRACFLNASENNKDNKFNGKIPNNKKFFRNIPHIIAPKSNISNSMNTKKINQKLGSYLKKFNCQFNSIMNNNDSEENKKENNNEILRKIENEINHDVKNRRKYNNYNFKMIYDSKKNKDNMDNIGYKEINNNTNRENYSSNTSDKIMNTEENHNNSNSYFIKNRMSNNHINYIINEITEEKGNNKESQIKEIKEYKFNYKNYMNNFRNKKISNINKKIYNGSYENYFSRKNSEEYNTVDLKEIKAINEVKEDEYKIQDYKSDKNNINKQLFSNISKKEKLKSKKNNLFMIRKQKTDEEEKLAQKNIAIVEIKENERKSINNTNDDKDDITYEKNKKLKYLSKLLMNGTKHFNNIKKSLSNYNHSFVNINSCKNKDKNSTTFYKIRGANKENSCSNLRNNIKKEIMGENFKVRPSFEDLNCSNKQSEKYLLINKLNIDNEKINNDNKMNHIIVTSYNLKRKKKDNTNEEISKEVISNKNIINSHRNTTNNIKYTERNSTNNIKNYERNACSNLNAPNSNRNTCHIDNKINIKTMDNLNIYMKKTKKYQNGTYEGIMLNDKREIKGIMLYNNGAKYDGQWRNDKKNGKGIFTSSNYYNCKNKIGMKYEGEFKDDRFEGYGVVTYTNGDKYEGEWKRSKQYGKGTVTYFDGSKYVGEWKDGSFDGNGIFYLRNGERFEGNFVNNKYNGYGKYYYNNGDYLEGIFKNDLPFGNCLLHKTDGTIMNIHH